ncbi:MULTISPECIES: O-antigen polymerase [unclassified Variovorax]|uniref:O-antigen polymerase n=1 Tax=unclassified Variovorax TaxID=663243 RepID=UPI00257841C7|nr:MULTISPECIES: O-antigen polymerase [unclassified Variovorax]MDM0090584.1 O-antigen polymerase [Variovorax sp. J22G40]MDM0147751.1 O-antigen polymerase [Variovorax sp. J2P1-31]
MSTIFIVFLLAPFCFFASRLVQRGVARTWVTRFAIWWSLLLCISSLNPFGINGIEWGVYFLFFVFIASYVIAFSSAFGRKPVAQPQIASLLTSYDATMNSRVTVSVLLVSAAILSYYCIKYFNFIEISGLGESRSAKYEIGKIFTSGVEFAAFNYLVVGVVWWAKFLLSFGVVFGRVKSFSWLLALVVCVLYLAFGAGRNIAVEIAVIMIFLNSIRKFSGEGARSGKWIFLVMAFLYLLSVYATASRMTLANEIDLSSFLAANNTFVEQAILYCVGAFRAFQFAYQNYDAVIGYQFGRLTLGGFDEIFSYLIKMAGATGDPAVWRVGALLGDEIDIGGGNDFNALYTAVFSFYYDFGVAGVILFGSFFGALSAVMLRKFLISWSMRYIFISSIFFMSAILSPLTWKLQSGALIIVLLCAGIRVRFAGRVGSGF